MPPTQISPALAAIDTYPHLRQQVAASLDVQAQRIAERITHFIPRTAVIKALDERIAAETGGVLSLEGPPGSGTTSLLCYLAATRPYPIWLPEDDAGSGMEALCAQLLALHGLPTPLVPPGAGRDSSTLERLLSEAAARRADNGPLVVLIDRAPDRRDAALPPPIPIAIPPNVIVVLAGPLRSGPTGRLVARIALPVKSARTERRLSQAAMKLGRSAESARDIAAAAEGSFLYMRLAVGLLETGVLSAGALPAGIDALHAAWWDTLDAAERRAAALLAAAGEPIDPDLLATVAEIDSPDVRRFLLRWRPMLERSELARFYHTSTRDFIAASSGDDLAGAHATYVALAQAHAAGPIENLAPQTDGYLVRQLARHASQSDAQTRATLLPALASRAWVRASERHTGDMREAAHDATWTMHAATQVGQPLQLVRSAALAGTLMLLSRSLPPDALAEAFLETLARGGARDETLRRVRAMLEQLPEDRDKALVLRRLGEACYAQGMRAPAMRMLSEALDLEAPGLPRVWRDEREETLVAFARAAVAIGDTDTALGITARIGHAERRGMIETEVVRRLLSADQRTRAEEVAYAIGHQPMHEWAMAEVAVGHVRAGDTARAELVLSILKTETAIAWALAELASDAAHRGDARALERVSRLGSERLRDRSLTLVSQALAAGGHIALALETARMASDREVRARALIDVVQQHPEAAAALGDATNDVAAISGDERAPLVAALAAAYAASGQISLGLQIAERLPEGEERDRAQSRVAVALARRGDEAAARQIVLDIADDDERDWAIDEIARIIAEQRRWQSAFALTEQIVDTQQRAHTEADLTIAWARAGHAEAAHARVAQIALPNERVRIYCTIVETLVRQGGKATALNTLAQLPDADARSRYQAALAAALASHGELLAAHGFARGVSRPNDRARALIAIARASASGEAATSTTALGEALRATVALGRKETFACLGAAADVLAMLDGADLLLAAASALDEIDSWWDY